LEAGDGGGSAADAGVAEAEKDRAAPVSRLDEASTAAAEQAAAGSQARGAEHDAAKAAAAAGSTLVRVRLARAARAGAARRNMGAVGGVGRWVDTRGNARLRER
jgi:hypothetical protein